MYLNLHMETIFSIINFVKFADNEDSFQEVARYGTSETPSDLKGDYEDYGASIMRDMMMKDLRRTIETFRCN